jgi:hypothetical protein
LSKAFLGVNIGFFAHYNFILILTVISKQPQSYNPIMFKGRKLIIATKHQKERIISPLLEKNLGVKCFVPKDFDTDVFGTFSGEIERNSDPISTARAKCLKAMKISGCDLGIASEGSFGPHPSLYFINADEEFLIFIDQKNNLEILAREISTDTNFNGEEIQTTEALQKFADKALFPSHGLILRKSKEENTEIVKGLTEWKKLHNVFSRFITLYGKAYVETDMRAMYNPSRMQVIEKVSQKLIEKINSTCPDCHTPGFEIVDAISGLPCKLCGSPTKSVLSYTWACKKCKHISEEKYPNGKTKEDPGYCDRCNP